MPLQYICRYPLSNLPVQFGLSERTSVQANYWISEDDIADMIFFKREMGESSNGLKQRYSVTALPETKKGQYFSRYWSISHGVT